MPVIKPYALKTAANTVPDVQRIRPTEDEGEGKGLEHLSGAISNFAGALSKRENQDDVSNTHVALTQAQADLTNDYHQQLQDGTLDVDKFKDSVQKKMDGIEDGVSTGAGSNYFKKASAELQAHFLTTTAQGSAQLAGEKAKSNYMTSLNNSSSTLLNDPSAFEFTQSQQMQGIDALVAGGGLPAEAAGKLKDHSNTDLAKNAVRGWIRLDPEMAKKKLDDNTFGDYIDGDLKHQLYSEIETQNHANDAKIKQNEKLIKDAKEAEQTKTQNAFLQKMTDGNLKPQEVLDSNLDAFGSGSKEQFVQMIKRQNNETKEDKIKTDPGTYINLWDRVHLPDGDPNKIVDENDLNKYMGRGLDVSAVNVLRGEIQGKKTDAGAIEAALKKGFTEVARGKLTRSNALTGVRDPIGDEQYQRFLSDFSNTYQQKRQTGKTPQELLNPDSPEYLGKSITTYVRTNKQIMQDLVRSQATVPSKPSAVVSPPMPRQQGESAADYLKRIGK